MSKKSVKIKNGEIESIYRILLNISQLKRVPLKKNIALNLKAFEETLIKNREEKEIIYKEMIALDESGEYALKKEYVLEDSSQNVPLEAFELQKDYELKDLLKRLNSFAEEEIEVNLLFEKEDREILISNNSGAFEKISLLDYLNNPNNDLSSGDLIVLYKYVVEE